MPIDIAGLDISDLFTQVESLSAWADEQTQKLITYRAEVNNVIAKLASEAGGLEAREKNLKSLLITAAYYLERYARSVPSESANWSAVTKLLMQVHEATQ